jgi:hypothetical protein
MRANFRALIFFLLLLLLLSPSSTVIAQHSASSPTKSSPLHLFSTNLATISPLLSSSTLQSLQNLAPTDSLPCTAIITFPSTYYNSLNSHAVASLTTTISECWGQETAGLAFNLVGSDMPSPIFTPHDLDSCLVAFNTFSQIDDRESMMQVADFMAMSLTGSSQQNNFCKSTMNEHAFAELVYKVFNYVEHNYLDVDLAFVNSNFGSSAETKTARDSLAACLATAEAAVADLAAREHERDVQDGDFARTRDVVVARGRAEDISWINGISVRHTTECVNKLSCGEDAKRSADSIDKKATLAELGYNAHVYTKTSPAATRGGGMDVPYNTAGEAVLYLYHIIRHYDDLPAATAFLQGEPVAGKSGATVHFNSLEELHEKLAGVNEHDRFQPLSNLVAINDWLTGAPYDTAVSPNLYSGQVELFELLTRSKWVNDRGGLWWHAGGLFAVTKQAIRSRPKYVYENLYTMLTSAYPPNLDYPVVGITRGGVLDPFCDTSKEGYRPVHGLYCTQYNIYSLFYVIERTWPFVFDQANPLWRVDICSEEVKAAIAREQRVEFVNKFCNGDEGAREDGWLIKFLKKFVDDN